MDITKSSRHAKITGDFGEALVLYWLSKYGYECARVDHTGIDIIASNPSTGELMGISVKTRCRLPGTERDTVNISIANLEKARKACKAFHCIPYFAVVVDTGQTIFAFLLSMDHLIKISPPTDRNCYWRMNPKDLAQYEQDPEISIFKFQSDKIRM